MPWQPWSTAPKDGTIILATWMAGATRIMQPVHWRNGQWLHTWDHGMLPTGPTEWMPMPDAPEAQ